MHQLHLADVCREGGTCLPQFVTSGMSRNSAAIASTKAYWFYIYLRHFHNARIGAWWMRRKQMHITPNYLLFDSLQSWIVRHDLELQGNDAAWLFLFHNFPKICTCLSIVFFTSMFYCCSKAAIAGDSDSEQTKKQKKKAEKEKKNQ